MFQTGRFTLCRCRAFELRTFFINNYLTNIDTYIFFKEIFSVLRVDSLTRDSVAVLINSAILYKKPRREFHFAKPLKKRIRLRVTIIACRQMQSLATTNWIAYRRIAIEITSRAIFRIRVYLNPLLDL